MPLWLILAIFFFIVVTSHVIEGITGFGSTALSIPFLAVLIGIEIAKPVLMLYTLFLCVYVLARCWREVRWRNLGVILGMAALGIPIGLLIYNRLPRVLLLCLLAIFMIAVSIRGLLFAFGFVKQKKEPAHILLLAALFLGGIIQGAFASGGPLLVLYSAEKIRDKSQFRATMCMVWLVIDIVLLLQMAFAGQLGGEVWRIGLWGFPFLIVGTILGDIAHRRVSDALFLKLTYGILLVSGIFLLASL